MSAGTDQWLWWRDALAGKPVESEVGNPRSGFWKAPNDEPIAIWRDEHGTVCCDRVRFGGGANMPLDRIDELYSQASRYPLDEATYDAARRGEPPPGFKTRLSLKEIQAGAVWSLALGVKKLGGDNPDRVVQPTATVNKGSAWNGTQSGADNPRAVIGDNLPPEPTPTVSGGPSGPAVGPAPPGHTHDGPQTPDMVLLAEVSALGAQAKVYLDSIGGTPRNKPEADTVADYATRFKVLSNRAETARKAEKQPHLDAEREIDARWKRPKDNADGSRKRCLEIGDVWIAVENARLKAEADAANARAAAAAERHAEQFDAPVTPPPPVEAERVTGIGNIRTVAQRTREVWAVTDPRAYATHIIAQDGDLPADLVEVLEKIARRRAMEAPGVTKQIQRSAA